VARSDDSPGANVEYPRDGVKSHHYAARDVDASPLQVGTQHEKFLFYRGLADFQPSIAATVDKHGDVNATKSAGTPPWCCSRIATAVWGIGSPTSGHAVVTLSRPSLNGSVDALRRSSKRC
jgi:hypothetical protein